MKPVIYGRNKELIMPQRYITLFAVCADTEADDLRELIRTYKRNADGDHMIFGGIGALHGMPDVERVGAIAVDSWEEKEGFVYITLEAERRYRPVRMSDGVEFDLPLSICGFLKNRDGGYDHSFLETLMCEMEIYGPRDSALLNTWVYDIARLSGIVKRAIRGKKNQTEREAGIDIVIKRLAEEDS